MDSIMYITRVCFCFSSFFSFFLATPFSPNYSLHQQGRQLPDRTIHQARGMTTHGTLLRKVTGMTAHLINGTRGAATGTATILPSHTAVTALFPNIVAASNDAAGLTENVRKPNGNQQANESNNGTMPRVVGMNRHTIYGNAE